MTEAGVAAESLFAGLTALRKANYAQKSLYNHAFFSISIGLERMMKLAILVECRTRPNGAYPTEKEFRDKYGHNLKRLFAKIEEIREDYSDRLRWDLPNREISMAALNILSDFAEFTRYYNLNVLVGSSRVGKQREPIEAWFSDVAAWILQNKYSQRQAKSDKQFAHLSEQMYGQFTAVVHLGEDGSPISSVHDAALRSRQMEVIQREGTVICACIARHISELLYELTWSARRAGATDIPALYEYFPLLMNDETLFRQRKTFSILAEDE